MTGRELVAASLRLIGALAPGEPLAAQEAKDGLDSINRMIDSWSNDGLMVYSITQEAPLVLTPDVSTYTLGLAGDLPERPLQIVNAFLRVGTTDFPVRILSKDEYASIVLKGMKSTIPNALFDDGGYPQRKITLYPVPSQANSLVLYTKRHLPEIASLDDTITLPPGYERALAFNGAIELAPEYGKSVSAEVLKVADESKSSLKRANHKPSYLVVDDGTLGRSTVFNVYTGGYR